MLAEASQLLSTILSGTDTQLDGTTALKVINNAELQLAISSQDWDGIRVLAGLGVRIDSAISKGAWAPTNF